MGHDKQYESWKKQRAKVEVPGDFADRVMAPIRQTRQQTWVLLLQKSAAAALRSKVIRAAICSAAIAVWMIRVGSILAIFIPQ
ncbi:MAG: hypothetical protein ABSA26_05845 [Thermoguttaceae bacterium]